MFISRAIASISASLSPWALGNTASGFPSSGRSAKTSTRQKSYVRIRPRNAGPIFTCSGSPVPPQDDGTEGPADDPGGAVQDREPGERVRCDDKERDREEQGREPHGPQVAPFLRADSEREPHEEGGGPHRHDELLAQHERADRRAGRGPQDQEDDEEPREAEESEEEDPPQGGPASPLLEPFADLPVQEGRRSDSQCCRDSRDRCGGDRVRDREEDEDDRANGQDEHPDQDDNRDDPVHREQRDVPKEGEEQQEDGARGKEGREDVREVRLLGHPVPLTPRPTKGFRRENGSRDTFFPGAPMDPRPRKDHGEESAGDTVLRIPDRGPPGRGPRPALSGERDPGDDPRRREARRDQPLPGIPGLRPAEGDRRGRPRGPPRT